MSLHLCVSQRHPKFNCSNVNSHISCLVSTYQAWSFFWFLKSANDTTKYPLEEAWGYPEYHFLFHICTYSVTKPYQCDSEISLGSVSFTVTTGTSTPRLTLTCHIPNQPTRNHHTDLLKMPTLEHVTALFEIFGFWLLLQ